MNADARCVTVHIRDADWKDRQRSLTLPDPVTTREAILPVARMLLADLRRARRVAERLLGVKLSNLGDLATRQLNLFDTAGAPALGGERPRDRALAEAVEAVRSRFGPSAV